MLKTTAKRHAAYIRHRMAATKDGLITAIDVDTVLDKGAYMSLCGGKPPLSGVIMRTIMKAGGAYNIPNAKARSRAGFTNHPYAGAFRGFGVPQATFAVECQVDELARRLGMDPVELRLKNILRHGDCSITGQVMLECRGLGLDECIQKVKAKINWDRPFDRGAGAVKRGRGFAVFMYGTGAPGATEGANCYASLEYDGTLSVGVGSTEMGQGAVTALGQIAAQTLGVKMGDVLVSFSDTGNSPDCGPTVSSRTITVVGNAVANACSQLRERLITVAAARVFREDAANITIEGGQVFVKDRPDKAEALAAIIRQALLAQVSLAVVGSWYPPQPKIRADDAQGDPHHAYSFGAQAVEVAVDVETGEISVLRSVMACDVGTAINPGSVEGQMEGAVAQGIGWAVMEETIMENGVMQNTAFHNYLIPTAKDLPNLESIIVEHPNELGPFGAKGAGELPILGTAPAIRNALYDALGFKINVIPLTARRVLAQIRKEAACGKGVETAAEK